MEVWLSVTQLANYLSVSKETIYRLLKANEIPSHRIGKLHKFKASEIDKWLTKKKSN